MFNHIKKNYESNLVFIPVNGISLEAELTSPKFSKGLVIFSHGSGSSRTSPRNKIVAKFLNNYGYSTLLADLLTKDEEKDFNSRFDIDLLTERLLVVTDWTTHNSLISKLPIAYFGASTGSAAALRAAVGAGDTIKAIVSRGGRVDLALENIEQLTVPTLLIIGSIDKEIIRINKDVYKLIKCPKDLVLIPGASHLFEEQGKLDKVAELATKWLDENI